MADLDVALRLRLENQLSGQAKRAEQDLKDIRRAADVLGVGKGAADLQGDLRGVEREAGIARSRLAAIRTAAGQMGTSRGPAELGAHLRQTGAAANIAKSAVHGIGVAADALGNQDHLSRFRRQVDSAGQHVDGLKRRLGALGDTAPGIRRVGQAADGLSSGARSAFAGLMAFAAPAAILAGLSQLERKFLDVDRAAAGVALTAEMRDPKARQQIIAENKRFGRDLGAAQSEIGAARQVFTGGGVSLADQTTLLPQTLKAAIGAGAPADVIARAGQAYVQTLKGKPQDIGAAYDIMAKGGKLGTVELPDIARSLPQLGSQYSAAGGSGTQALSELVAMLEVAGKGAGSPDEAANNVSNYLAKLFSPETVANFKKRHVNLPKLVAGARENGQHPALAILDEAQRLTKGDPFKMGELFGDQQVMSALRPLMENRGQLDAWTKDLSTTSKGTAEADYAYRLTTPSGREDVQSARREAAGLSIGQAMQSGAEAGSGAYTRFMEHLGGISETFTKDGAEAAFMAAIGVRRAAPETPTEIETKIAARRGDLALLQADRDALPNPPDDMPGKAATDYARANIDLRMDQLRRAIEALTEQLRDAQQGGVDPIAFRSGLAGGPILIPASFRTGEGRAGGSGGAAYRGAYDGTAPVMDGMAGAGGGSAGGASRGAAPFLAGAPSEPRSWPDLSAAAFLGGDVASYPAGMRNNNPGNLKYSGSAWQRANLPGLVGPSANTDEGDPQAVFNSPQAGLEAMARLAVGKFDGGRKSVRDMISAPGGWTPGKDFAAVNVARTMGVDPGAAVNLRDPATMQGIMRALIQQEHGAKGSAYTDDMIAAAAEQTLSGGGSAARARAASQFGAGGPLAPVTYTNRGATRDRPVTPALLEAIQRGVSAVYGEGYRAEIYSGGQAAKGMLGRRTGSTRHDDHGAGGEAADLYVYGPNGQRVTGTDLAKLGQHWEATNQGGVGLEMRGGGIHLDQHRDRARSWNYARQGGRYTREQAAIIGRGLAGIPPAYVNPGALDPAKAAEAAEALTGSAFSKAAKPMPSWDQLTRQPKPGAGAGPGRAPSGPARQARPVVVHQNFAGVDPGVQARRATREMHRSIRQAEARAMHDTAVPIA